MPGRIEAACIVCGRGFSFEPKARGRHPRFCSADCKAARHLEQQRERRAYLARQKARKFAASPPQIEVTCRHCGRTFTYPSKHGRLRRYCSPSCGAAARQLQDHARRERAADTQSAPAPSLKGAGGNGDRGIDL